MPATVIIGGQWGDEGKGRVVDYHARHCSIIARYSAGTNAGHTIVNDRGHFALHLVPAGIFYGDKTCVIGKGVVVEPIGLLKELAMLGERAVDTSKLLISERAHVVMPWHPVIDRLDEAMRGEHAIGTTGTGTGPAFTDKVSRNGVRVVDLITPELLASKLETVLPYKNRIITELYGGEALDFDTVFREYRDFGAILAPHVTDVDTIVQDAHDAGERILLEGAQGALLDLDSGTYPYVTSSVPASVAAGASIGIGLGPTAIERVVGVYKAYQTRVGNGPMPTELFGEEAERLRDPANAQGQGEYGATTGRSRRCGWFDGVLARYTSRLNGVNSVALTRLDVLSQFDSIKVCVAYERNGERVHTLPAALPQQYEVTPVYEDLPGWRTDVSGVRSLGDLPANARAYVRRIEQLIGAPIDMISVGPQREQVIVTHDIFGAEL